MGKGLSDLQKHILVEAYLQHRGEWPRWAVTATFNPFTACNTPEEYRAAFAQLAGSVSASLARPKGEGGDALQVSQANQRNQREIEQDELIAILTASDIDPQWPNGCDYAVLAYVDTANEADALIDALKAQFYRKPVLLDRLLLLPTGKAPAGDLRILRIYHSFYNFPLRLEYYRQEGGVRSTGREAEYRSARAAVSRAIARLQNRDLVAKLFNVLGTRTRSIALTPSGAQLAQELMVNNGNVATVNRYAEHLAFPL